MPSSSSGDGPQISAVPEIRQKFSVKLLSLLSFSLAGLVNARKSEELNWRVEKYPDAVHRPLSGVVPLTFVSWTKGRSPLRQHFRSFLFHWEWSNEGNAHVTCNWANLDL